MGKPTDFLQPYMDLSVINKDWFKYEFSWHEKFKLNSTFETSSQVGQTKCISILGSLCILYFLKYVKKLEAMYTFSKLWRIMIMLDMTLESKFTIGFVFTVFTRKRLFSSMNQHMSLNNLKWNHILGTIRTCPSSANQSNWGILK